MSELVLQAEGLRKSFGEIEAVKGVSFHIAEGETYGLLGPNGAGKTTTISMVTGLLERDAGSVVVDGREITTTSTAAKVAIGYVPQDIAVYPDLTGRENLTFFGHLYGMKGKGLSSRVDEVLEIIGLRTRADDRADEYSGGMKRRLNIGIGLLHRPRLLMLDEPTVGVDPQSRNAILESVEHLSEAGMAVLYTTHYMEEAERLCDRVGIIDLGVIMAEGTREELVAVVGERDRVRLTATGHLVAAEEALHSLTPVEEASIHDDGIDLLVRGANVALPSILQAAAGAGASVTSVDVDEPNLEAVFLHLTGKALRDTGEEADAMEAAAVGEAGGEE
jgi:ABC-2 type transport system ATP-binding protein